MALPSVRTAAESFIITLERAALTAPSGFLRFSCHIFPLRGLHSTHAPPQITSLVVLKLLSDLAPQARSWVFHVGCCL